jgi:hypothetical protein
LGGQILDWLKSISQPYKIDPITEQVYNELIDYFDRQRRCTGYKNIKGRLPRPTTNDDIKEIAEEIYGYFSAHYCKAWHTFIQQEKLHGNEAFIKQPVTIIDIGCGIGTATYALIDLLRYKHAKNKHNSLIEIKVIFVELSKIKSKLLKTCIENYKSKCTNVKIRYEIIDTAFPNCIEDIKKLVKYDKNILIIMSNLVNWLHNDPYEMGKGIHKINMENPDIYDIKVINIEGHKLREKISKQYDYLANKGIYHINGPTDNNTKKITYINAKRSYWSEIRRKKRYTNKEGYLHGSVKSIPLIKAISDPKMLEIAFFKARHAQRSQSLLDEIEVKYIESNLNNIIDLLVKELNEYNGYKYTNEFLEYQAPKNEKDFRPMVIEDLKNDIISASLLMTMGDSVDDVQDMLKNEVYSFGNRLNNILKSPYIFQLFTQKYFNEYIAKAKQISEESQYNYCVQADIKSFYTRVDKKLLKEIINKTLPDTILWVKNTLYSFIDREFNGCENDRGIPQGVFMSNLLANLYLTALDEEISSLNNLKYVRYVDDFYIFSTTEKEAQEVYSKVKAVLENILLLNLNEDKSGISESSELHWPGNREFFEDTKHKINQILRTIYKIDNKNYKKYKKYPKEFIEALHECLKLIGVYIPQNWLQIKIESELSFIEKMIKLFKQPSDFFKWASRKQIYKKHDIKWGNIPLKLDKKALSKWKRKFDKNNKILIKEITELSDTLANEFLNNFRKVITDTKIGEYEKKESLRIAKYCFNHLGRFKSNKILNEFENMIKNPWLLNLRPLRAYPQLAPKLIKLIDEKKDNNYLLLNIIWLLGEMKDKNAAKKITKHYLSTINAENKEDILLNTICTEALLKINYWSKFPFEELYRKIKGWLDKRVRPNYRLIRNSFIILSMGGLENFDETVQDAIKIWENDEYITTFLNWLDQVENPNIINNFDYVTEEVKKMYPLTEPEPNNYQS